MYSARLGRFLLIPEEILNVVFVLFVVVVGLLDLNCCCSYIDDDNTDELLLLSLLILFL